MMSRVNVGARAEANAFFTAQDPSKNLAKIFVNEGDVYNRSDGTQHSYVTVVDTNTQEVPQEQGYTLSLLRSLP